MTLKQLSKFCRRLEDNGWVEHAISTRYTTYRKKNWNCCTDWWCGIVKFYKGNLR